MGGLFSCFDRGRISSERVLKKYGAWEKPSEAAAQSSTLYFRSHHHAFSIFKTNFADLHEFGEGHTLYFFFLQSISRLFFIIFLFSGLPTLVVSLLGNLYQELVLDSVTLGNVGHFRNLNFSITNFTTDLNSKASGSSGKRVKRWDSFTGLENEQAFVDVFREPSNASLALLSEQSRLTKLDAVIVISILDAFAALFFFVSVIFLGHMQHRIAKEVDCRVVTVADYSIRVENLPEDTRTAELKEFFSRWGNVRSVEMVKTDCELIERARIDKIIAEDIRVAVARATKVATKRRGRKISPLPLARVRMQEIRKEKADTYTRRLHRERRSARVVCAFVTMDDPDRRVALINAFPNSFGRRLFTRRSQRFRRRFRIKALPAPEPADIIWENLMFGFFGRRLRCTITTSIKYLTLLVGFLFINFATSLRHNNPATTDQKQCDAECQYFTEDGDLYLIPALQERYKDCYKDTTNSCSDLESSCYQCYCENAVIKGIRREESGYCAKYLADFATATASEIVAVMGIVFINLSLAMLASRLSKTERHHTRIRQETSTALALFLFQFINTAISTLVATTHIPRLNNLVKGTTLEERLFVGVYVDTTPNWYREVGRSLTITMIVQSGSRIVRVLIRWLLQTFKFCSRRTSLTQHQLNEAYMGPEFELASRYGELLNLVFVTMFFGGGIPLLYLVTAISFQLQFLVEKAELLKLSRRPTSYGPDLAKRVSKILPFAALWHYGFSAWAFSFQRTERSPLVARSAEKCLKWLDTAIRHVTDEKDNVGKQTRMLGERLMEATAAHHIALFVVIAVFLVARLTTSIWMKAVKYVASLVGIIKNTGLGNSDSSHLPGIDVAISSGLMIGPTSYSLKSNPKYMSTLPTNKWDSERVDDHETARKGQRLLCQLEEEEI